MEKIRIQHGRTIARAYGPRRRRCPRAPAPDLSDDADLAPDLAADTLTVRLHHLTQAAHDRAIEELLAELNATQTVFPGTKLTMVFKLGST
jgi:hypothetical protein